MTDKDSTMIKVFSLIKHPNNNKTIQENAKLEEENAKLKKEIITQKQEIMRLNSQLKVTHRQYNLCKEMLRMITLEHTKKLIINNRLCTCLILLRFTHT